MQSLIHLAYKTFCSYDWEENSFSFMFKKKDVWNYREYTHIYIINARDAEINKHDA